MASIGIIRSGQAWAWRNETSSPVFHEALVRQVGEKKVQVELVADHWEGERRWVSPARLEVRWSDRHDYIELDRKLRAVTAWSPSQLDRRTAEHVFIKLIPLEIAEFNADSAGTSVVHDIPALARLAGLTPDDLRAEPAFLHEHELTVPWKTTERIGRAVAAKYPHKLLSRIEREEREANERALHGVTLTDFEGEDHHLGPADARERFEKRQKPYLDKLREWIGAERAADLLERRELGSARKSCCRRYRSAGRA
ncbi:hypothetical protein [Curtobacterium citreum]|uniref:hypothetical protein n=1 Tax=Curtobacterium citreum TaxID=2036 RepID=UPI002542D3BD|nr:hypothetical protein [Curtobacterium citreum]WIJ46185.1 hypothetical protein QPK07_04250 [Curtobacterium citreum]